MARIDHLRDIDSSVRKQLKRAGVKTGEELWRRLGLKLDHGLAKMARESNLSTRQLEEVLIEDLLSSEQPPELRPRHWLMATAAVGLSLGTVLVAGTTGGWFPWAGKTARPTTVVVVAEGEVGLTPLHILRENDITLVQRQPPRGGFSRKQDVLGRMLLGPLRHGQAILEDDLGPPGVSKADLDGRYALVVTLAPGSSGRHIVAGGRLALIFSPQGTARSARCKGGEVEAIVLKVETRATEGTVLTVAIKDALLREVAPLLSCCEVFASLPARQPLTPPSPTATQR